ncbi:MAG: hypothetical protein V5A55_09610 [Halovenus sp.]
MTHMGVEDYYGRDTSDLAPFEAGIAWRGGAVAGFGATLASVLLITAVEPEMLSQTVAGMYGLSGSLSAGLVAHLVHGTVFGVVFAVVLSDPVLVWVTDWLWKSVLAGVVFALLLAVIGTGFLLPVWLEFAGFGTALSLPYVTNVLFAWHVLYGFVLGLVFPFVDGL